MSERLLITGASGFIGRALRARAARDGLAVRSSVRRIEIAQDGDQIIVGNLDETTDWSKALIGVDVVVHLAAHVHVAPAATIAAADAPAHEFRRVNLLATRQLAESAARNGVRRLVFLSTVKVHGERSADGPFDESCLPHPADAYAISKWEAEQALLEVADRTGLEAVILRPPLVYGPGVKANFLRLLRAVDRGVPMPLGMIDNRRSLIFLDNLVDAIALCVSHPAAAGKTYLPSDGEDVSAPQLVRLLAKALGRRPRLISVPVPLLRALGRITGRSDAVARLADSLQVDSRRIRGELDWQPPSTLRQGLEATARWWRSLNPGP